MKQVCPLVALLAVGPVGATPPAMQPGLWEVTMNVEMAGMAHPMPTSTFEHCYRAEDIADLRRTVPQQQGDCKVSDWKQSGRTATWSMRCAGETPMILSGRMTYGGDRYSGVITATMNHGRQKRDITQRIEARRIGDCR